MIKLYITIFAVGVFLTGCSTVSGTVSGAGQDLQKAGEWIDNEYNDGRMTKRGSL